MSWMDDATPVSNSSGASGWMAEATPVDQKQGVGSILANASQAVLNNPAFSENPITGPVRIQNSAQRMFNKAGEATAETLAKKGVNPYVSAAAGTALQMEPDIAQATLMPDVSTGIGETTAQNAGMKTLGFSKRFLKTPKALQGAREATQTMIDKGVVGLGGAEGIADRLSALVDKSGSRIGEILQTLDNKGKFFDTNSAIKSLEELRPVDEAGKVLTQGAHKYLNRQIDEAIATIKDYGDKIGLGTANKIKGMLQSGVQWEGKGPSNLMDRLIAGRFRESVDSQLDNAASELEKKALPGPGSDKAASLSKEFQVHKKLYSHAKRVEDPIYNRISSELGNKGVGLTDWIAMAPELAAGDPLTALGTFIAKRGAERVLPVAVARGANAVAKAPVSKISPTMYSAFQDWIDSVKKKDSGNQK